MATSPAAVEHADQRRGGVPEGMRLPRANGSNEGTTSVSDIAKESELLAALAKLPELARSGLTAEAGNPRGTMITYSGHVRGIWHCERGRYRYTPAGYGIATHQADTLEDAIRITLALI